MTVTGRTRNLGDKIRLATGVSRRRFARPGSPGQAHLVRFGQFALVPELSELRVLHDPEQELLVILGDRLSYARLDGLRVLSRLYSQIARRPDSNRPGRLAHFHVLDLNRPR